MTDVMYFVIIAFKLKKIINVCRNKTKKDGVTIGTYITIESAVTSKGPLGSGKRYSFLSELLELLFTSPLWGQILPQ